jgi:hypothetical protein
VRPIFFETRFHDDENENVLMMMRSFFFFFSKLYCVNFKTTVIISVDGVS